MTQRRHDSTNALNAMDVMNDATNVINALNALKVLNARNDAKTQRLMDAVIHQITRQTR